MRRLFGFLIGILVGSLVGSTVALLLAPETGERLRSEIRGRGESFVVEIRRAAELRRRQMTEQLESMRSSGTPRVS